MATLARGNELIAIFKTATYAAGLAVAIPSLLAGLFTLDERPMLGTLMLIAAMALLLSVLTELCRGEANVQEPDLEEKR